MSKLIMFLRFKISFRDSFVDTFLGKNACLLIEALFKRLKAIWENSGTIKFWLNVIYKRPFGLIFTSFSLT